MLPLTLLQWISLLSTPIYMTQSLQDILQANVSMFNLGVFLFRTVVLL